jgi:hypothetical protein
VLVEANSLNLDFSIHVSFGCKFDVYLHSQFPASGGKFHFDFLADPDNGTARHRCARWRSGVFIDEHWLTSPDYPRHLHPLGIEQAGDQLLKGDRLWLRDAARAQLPNRSDFHKWREAAGIAHPFRLNQISPLNFGNYDVGGQKIDAFGFIL